MRYVRLIENCSVGPVGNLDLRAQPHVIVISDLDDLLEHGLAMTSRQKAACLLCPIGRDLRRGNIERVYLCVGGAGEFNTNLRSTSRNGRAGNWCRNLDNPANRINIMELRATTTAEAPS